MMSSNLLPLKEQFELHLHHKYNFNFADVARAFFNKYNDENRLCMTTIAHMKQLDEDRFEIVRRMENVMSSKPLYERIIFNRSSKQVQGFTFEKECDNVYVEHYVYREDTKDSNNTVYDMFLYKNPGLQKFLRFKLHNWGVQTMTNMIKKDMEMRAMLREQTEKLKEAKDKLQAKVVEKLHLSNDNTSS